MAELEELQTFDIAGATVSVWTFKKSTPTGQPPAFSGRWIDIDDVLAAALREALVNVRAGIAETHPYGLLAQVNEGSALVLGADEPTPQRSSPKLLIRSQPGGSVSSKESRNSAFYVVKLVAGGQTLHAVRRADNTWRTRKTLTSLNVFYTNEGLTLDLTPRFTLSRYFDFLIHDGVVFVLDKNRFESVLSYKETQIEDFTALQAEPDFVAIFADVAPLVAFVGSNRNSPPPSVRYPRERQLRQRCLHCSPPPRAHSDGLQFRLR